jgi:hypothetical protein
MNIDKFIKLALVFVIAAAATGHLPAFTTAIRRAQVQLLQESRASHWGSPDLLSQHGNWGQLSPRAENSWSR